MPYGGLLDTHNIIVNAIRDDVAAAACVTVGDCTLTDVDDHDPLGLAFYTFALLETGYTNQELAPFIDSWHYWVEEKVTDEWVSPYTDRDLAAIGLIVFALCKHRTCPNVSGKLAPLTEKHFSDSRGLFDNFLATVLVALGLGKLPAEAPLYDRFARYVNSQLRDHSDTIFNDAKNIVVAYIWSKENREEEFLRKIRQVCLNGVAREDILPRDLVYLTYVLFEEVESLRREEKPKVKECVEESLRFIQTYSLEAGFSRDILDEFREDIALEPPDVMRQYSYTVRPRLSRILISIGHLIEQRYAFKPYLLSDAQRKRQWLRGITYPVFLIFCVIVVIYLGLIIGLPLNGKSNFATKSFMPIIIGVFKLIINTAWLTLIAAVITGSIILAYRFLYTAEDVDDLEALKNAGEKVLEIIWGDIIAATILSLVITFSGSS